MPVASFRYAASEYRLHHRGGGELTEPGLSSQSDDDKNTSYALSEVVIANGSQGIANVSRSGGAGECH